VDKIGHRTQALHAICTPVDASALLNYTSISDRLAGALDGIQRAATMTWSDAACLSAQQRSARPDSVRRQPMQGRKKRA
jgi:hypothetical protein